MLVFISWSGKRSKAVAGVLEVWLQGVIQAVEPWISSSIEKGSRWSPQIAQKLEDSRVGIICLTKDNLDSPWILFEAGALSKKMTDAHVCTLLVDISFSDVEQPLAQFQHTRFEKADVFQLLKTINKTLETVKERPLTESVLKDVFEKNWPDLERQIQDTKTLAEDAPSDIRSDSEILQEILELARNHDRILNEVQRDRITVKLADALIRQQTSSLDPERTVSLAALAGFNTNRRGTSYVVPPVQESDQGLNSPPSPDELK